MINLVITLVNVISIPSAIFFASSYMNSYSFSYFIRTFH